MDKLVDLTGAMVTVPAEWSASAGFGQFYLEGYAFYKFSSDSGFTKSPLRSDMPSLYLGYGVGSTLETAKDFIFCRIVLDDGNFSAFTGYSSSQFRFKFEINGGIDASNPELIQWFLDNDAIIEGGIWEGDTQITYNETTTAITDGQKATLKCENKKMKTDVVINGICNIIYNDVITEISAGGIATLKCEYYKMASDVVVLRGKRITHCLYNGVKLPKIPKDILSEYPYAWIRNHTTNNQYQLILAAYPWYYNNAMCCSGGNDVTEKWYNIDKSTAISANEWVFNKNTTGNFGVSDTQPIMWSNHDIPNGSSTSTDIYFKGSKPVPIY